MWIESVRDVFCPYGCGSGHKPIPASQTVMDIIGYTWLVMAVTYLSFLAKRLFFRDEELFEPVFRRWRMRQAEKQLPKTRGMIVDVGCGRMEFLNRVEFSRKIGIDRKLPVVYDMDALAGLKKIKDSSADCITLLASMEHFTKDRAKKILKETHKALRKGGRVIVTIPTTRSRIPLKILVFIKLLSKEMIGEHKHYYGRREITSMLEDAGFKKIDYRLFELGFNSVITAEK